MFTPARARPKIWRLDVMENVSSVHLDVTVQEDIDAAA